MKLDQRVVRLEAANSTPVMAEEILAEALKLEFFDADRIGAMSMRMPQAELEKAISELGRMIEARDA